MVRQTIHISTNLAQVGASIATLVSGPGAPAAVAVKAAAAGVDASLPFIRWVKQAGHDRAARAAAKGEKNLATRLFNPQKGSVAKHAKRSGLARDLMRIAYDLLPHKQARAAAVQNYMAATGVDTVRLYELNGQPVQQHALIVKALYARELGD